MKNFVRSAKQIVYTLTILALLNFILASTTPASNASPEPEANKRTRRDDVEIRFEFYPIAPNMDDSVVPVFMVLARNGRAHALRYQLRYHTKNIKAYEGNLPEAEMQRFFMRVNAAFRLPRYSKDYKRGIVYEDNSFYLGLKSDKGKVKEMFGGDGPRPDELRTLLVELSELWKRLSEVPPAYAYLTGRAIEKDRLKLLRQKYKVNLTQIASMPPNLQAVLIPLVTQPRNFYPLTKTEYDQYRTYHRPLIYKGVGFEPELILSEKESKP